MERQKMITELLENIKLMNAWNVETGALTQTNLDKIVAETKTRYNKMSDLQLQNMCMINF